MLKKYFRVVALLTIFLGLKCQGTVSAQSSHYSTGFDRYEASHMELRSGTNGGMFNCTWKPENVAFNGGLMSLKIDGDGRGGYTGGEWRTRDYYGYGLYQVRMKPIKNSGVVSSFFTYTGPSDGTKWDEIDIEFLGKDTTKVQFNYFTDGKGDHEKLYDLGFDASAAFHTYGFDWQKDRITWYVDGKAVYTATNNIPETPGKIMVNAWPGIGVDEWLAPYNGRTPLYAYYDWISYDGSTSSANSSFSSGKTYKIVSKNSGYALDLAWGDSKNGANILQYPYQGNLNQKWLLKPISNGYYIIENSLSGKVLATQDKTAKDGGNVCQWEYQYHPSQEWEIISIGDNLYKIANRQTGLLLNVSYASKDRNANVEVYHDVNSPAQSWWIDLAN